MRPQCRSCPPGGTIASKTTHKEMFVEFNNLEPSQEVTLGDGYSVEATGCGTVRLNMQLTDDKTKECKMSDVLYVPQLSYNLLSVSKATQSGKESSSQRMTVTLQI